MTSTKLLSTLSYDIPSFVARTKHLITVDHHEEHTYDTAVKQRLTVRQLESLGILLTGIEISDVTTGLYGRQLITITNRKGLNKRLKAHEFRVRDVVQIRDNQHIVSSSTSSNTSDTHCIAQGTIYRIKEDSITIAVDNVNKGSNRNDDDNDSNTIDFDNIPNNIVLIQVPNEITYQRYTDVLTKLQHASQSLLDNTQPATRVLNILYNNHSPQCIDSSTVKHLEWTPINSSLNDIQKHAVTRCLLSNDIHLIHGPPGTGT
jgi:hypothetical protein